MHESMEGTEFDYFFEHGEFMPESEKQARLARNDTTIERPARKIARFDEDEYGSIPQPSSEPSVAEAPAAESEAKPETQPSDPDNKTE